MRNNASPTKGPLFVCFVYFVVQLPHGLKA